MYGELSAVTKYYPLRKLELSSQDSMLQGPFQLQLQIEAKFM